MLAAVKTEQKQEIVLQEQPIPHLKEGEVLVQVDYCGVCGSDLHAFHHARGYEFVPKPIILGHEISGKVIETYDSSLNHLKGKNVIVESMHYCNKCENCRKGRKSICERNQVIGLHFDGGMAEFVKTNASFIREYPEDLSSQIAALSEPMSIAVHAVEKAGDINENHTVLIQGPGIIGFCVSLVCIQKRAKVILSGLEKDYDNRLSKCSVFGITLHVAETGLLDEKADVVFECSGANAAVQAGWKHLKKGGRAVFVALYGQETSIYLTELVRNEWPLITSYGCDPKDYERAFTLLKTYEGLLLEHVVTLYSLSEVDQAFKSGSNQTVLKPVLAINQDRGEMTI
ncbi:zinc-binding dehydrogenase [Halobacillus sp. MO56]